MIRTDEQTSFKRKPRQVSTQAQRIFDKFGGVPALKKALDRVSEDAKRHVSAIYRWNLPKKNGGSNGLIPTSALGDVMKAARLEGVHLTPEDFFPAKEG